MIARRVRDRDQLLANQVIKRALRPEEPLTLTTLGYGDMVPASGLARSLVMLEAMCGQFFVAVFVARLVGSMGSTSRAPGVTPDD